MPTRRVVLLEDDGVLRALLSDALEEESLQVHLAVNVAELRQIIASGTMDLALADFWGNSHLQLTDAERIEISEIASQAPLILATGRAWAHSEDAASLGVVALLLKPFELDHLLACVHAGLEPTT